MVTKSPLFALGIKVIGLTAIASLFSFTTVTPQQMLVVEAQLTGATGALQQQQQQMAPTITTNATTTTTGAANNVTNSSAAITTTMSEVNWEAEVRERRQLAGLPLENNSTLPNYIKSAESLEIDRLQAQDPKFANFEIILDQCYNNGDSDPSNDIIPHSQCQARLEEASAAWCGVETYDAKKCDYVSNQSTWYEALYTIYSTLLLSP